MVVIFVFLIMIIFSSLLEEFTDYLKRKSRRAVALEQHRQFTQLLSSSTSQLRFLNSQETLAKTWRSSASHPATSNLQSGATRNLTLLSRRQLPAVVLSHTSTRRSLWRLLPRSTTESAQRQTFEITTETTWTRLTIWNCAQVNYFEPFAGGGKFTYLTF